jgi:putative acetyltransferase
MIKIRPLKPEEIPVAKRLIYQVAHKVFQDTRSLDESIAFYESKSLLQDIDDVEECYFNHDGIFLAMSDDDRIIGTGAVLKLTDEICELKRVWLLHEYHGRGLGYRIMQELLAFAREKGYARMRLETDQVYQDRAFNFYKRLGFYEIPRYSQHEDETAMELLLK